MNYPNLHIRRANYIDYSRTWRFIDFHSTDPIKHSGASRFRRRNFFDLLDETLERLGATIPGRMDEITFLDTFSIKIIGLKVETGAACNVVQTWMWHNLRSTFYPATQDLRGVLLHGSTIPAKSSQASTAHFSSTFLSTNK